jgi:hypothetical protein
MHHVVNSYAPRVDEVCEGMIIGLHSRSNDLPVHPTKGKQLTSIRAAGSDENILLMPPVRYSLEQSHDFIDDDLLIEITPRSMRLRKQHLTENERKRASRKADWLAWSDAWNIHLPLSFAGSPARSRPGPDILGVRWRPGHKTKRTHVRHRRFYR